MLLYIGVAASADVVRFARKAALDETCCFSGYYTAARLAMSGPVHANLQDVEWFRRQTRRYGFETEDIFLGNPPSAALLLTPIARLSPAEARIVWIWLSLIFWAGGIAALGVVITRRAKGSLVAAAPALLCLAMLFEPLKANLERAHVYLAIFLLQAVCCWLWMARRPSAAGAVGGTVLALKGYGVPLILVAILRRDWRFAGAFGVSFAVLAAAAGVLLGFHQWIWFAQAHLGGQLSAFGTPALQTMKSFAVTALGRAPATDRLVFSAETVLLVGLAVWLSGVRVLSWRPAPLPAPPPPSAAVLSACILINIILAPFAEDNAYALAMTALLLMIPELRRISIATAGVILGGVLLSWPFHLRDRTVIAWWQLVPDFARLWGGVILMSAALLAERRARRGGDTTPAGWSGAYLACAVGIGLIAWYEKPFRDPVNGPFLAVARADASVTLVRLDVEEREFATIPVSCKAISGLAIEPKAARLYVMCPERSTMSVVDLRSRREAAAFPIAKSTHVRIRDEDGELWMWDEAAPAVTIYRAGAPGVADEIATGPGVSDVVFSDGGSRAWISNRASGLVSLFDADRRLRIRDIRAGDGPGRMAMTTKGDRLLAANAHSGAISVIDVVEGRELAKIPVCSSPTGLVTSRRNGVELAYVICSGSASVSVIDVDHSAEVQRIALGEQPVGLAARPDSGRVYVSLGASNRIVVLETGAPSRILRRMQMDASPAAIAVAR